MKHIQIRNIYVWDTIFNAILCLFFIFSYKHILQNINVKNIHPVSGVGIRTHNLLNISILQ